VYIRTLTIKNFRCFDQLTLDFSAPITVITGSNGSGKSSLIEALHYGCYLRSFRTHQARALIAFGKETFIVQLLLGQPETAESHLLHIGFAGAKRVVRFDNTLVKSYKEISSVYRAVTISADDFLLIQGEPETRRIFLDQALSLYEPAMVMQLRAARRILEQRNYFLSQKKKLATAASEDEIWTYQLWKATRYIQEQRYIFIGKLCNKMNTLVSEWLDPDILIQLRYAPKKDMLQTDSFDLFLNQNQELFALEQVLGRSCFGVHLDDFAIDFRNRKSRQFASRGQQKLIVMLLKIAYMQLLLEYGEGGGQKYFFAR